MPGLTWSKIANDVQPFGCGFDIGIGKRAAVSYRKIGPGHFQDNNAHLGLSGGNLRRRKIAGSNIVVIPEAEMNRLATRKELPHLRRENAKVRTCIRSGLWPRVPR